MTTRNLAIFASDIVGSTPTTVALDRQAYDGFLTRYAQLVTPIVTRGRGEIFKSLGDGYLASFASSTDAVIAALEVQAQLETLTASMHLDQRFGTRIGISSGDVDVKNGDCFGVPVILATRVQSMAEPGTAYLTESVYYTMNRNEVALADLGYVSVKGFAERQRVFRADTKDAAPRTRSYAVLATDLRGFTVIGERDPELADRMMRTYDETILGVILASRGLVHYVVGDQYLATFNRASDAVLAAFRLQRAWTEVVEAARDRGDAYQHLIVGLDHGPHTRMAGRLWGTGLSGTASRVADLTGPSGVSATGELLDAVRVEAGPVSAALRAGEAEEVRRKGVATPLRVHTLALALDDVDG